MMSKRQAGRKLTLLSLAAFLAAIGIFLFIAGWQLGYSSGVHQVDMTTLESCIRSCSIFDNLSWRMV